MPETVRSLCKDIYEYTNDPDIAYKEEIASLSAEALGQGSIETRQRFQEAMQMLEKTGVLPQLLLSRRINLDQNQDGDLEKEELNRVLMAPKTNALDRLAAEYALDRFKEIREGWNPFDWYENLEEVEIQVNAEEGKEDPDMDPEDVFYGAVTEAPVVGAIEERLAHSCSQEQD